MSPSDADVERERTGREQEHAPPGDRVEEHQDALGEHDPEHQVPASLVQQRAEAPLTMLDRRRRTLHHENVAAQPYQVGTVSQLRPARASERPAATAVRR